MYLGLYGTTIDEIITAPVHIVFIMYIMKNDSEWCLSHQFVCYCNNNTEDGASPI